MTKVTEPVNQWVLYLHVLSIFGTGPLMGGAMLTSRDQPNATSYLCNPRIFPTRLQWIISLAEKVNDDGRLSVTHFYIGEYLKAFDFTLCCNINRKLLRLVGIRHCL